MLLEPAVEGAALRVAPAPVRQPGVMPGDRIGDDAAGWSEVVNRLDRARR